MENEVKQYPHFTPGNTPNRRQRRKDSGINKRGIHKPKEGRYMFLIIDKVLKFRHYIQYVPVKNKKGQITGIRKIIHTSI